MTLSDTTLNIISSSAELITSNDVKISKRMYEVLFSKFPKIKKLFSNAPEDQYMRLAEALSIYAVNIKKIEILKPALAVIVKRHATVNIKEHHYPMVGIALMQAIEDVLGEKATIEILDAWREAYQFLAHILMNMDKEYATIKASS